jgi:hypothetical protein
MVTGAGANHPFRHLVWPQQTHHIIGAPQFVGTHHLKVFPFKKNITLVFLRQIMVEGQRGPVHDFFQSQMG